MHGEREGICYLEDGDACGLEGLDNVRFGGDGGGSDEGEGGMAQGCPCKGYELPDVACGAHNQDSFALLFSISCHISLSLSLSLRNQSSKSQNQNTMGEGRSRGGYIYIYIYIKAV